MFLREFLMLHTGRHHVLNEDVFFAEAIFYLVNLDACFVTFGTPAGVDLALYFFRCSIT
jgi:hypothetical protein